MHECDEITVGAKWLKQYYGKEEWFTIRKLYNEDI